MKYKQPPNENILKQCEQNSRCCMSTGISFHFDVKRYADAEM